MAAIDPSAEPEGESGGAPRATLKIIRQSLEYDDSEDEDDEDFDVEEMERMLGEGDSDEDSDEDSSDDEGVNGGPSDPAKSKKARKAAAEKAIRELIENGADVEDIEMDEEPQINGTKSAKALGKMPASDESEDEDDDEDSEDDDEWEEFVLCTLDLTHFNQPIDITIGERERVMFKVSGTHSIHLTGNYVEPAVHDHGDMYDDSDESDEEDYDIDDLDEDISDEEEDHLDALGRIEEVSEDEAEAPALVAAKSDKKEKKGKNKRPAEDDGIAGAEDIDSMIQKEEKLSKKQLKKQKKNDGSAAAVEEAKKDEPSSAKSDKKVLFAKPLEQGPTPTKDAKASDKSKATLGVKTVQGVKIDDKKLGTGPAAKSGDRVSMRYIGKLEKDGKVFDSNKKGKPFSFKLGAGEVIKGWDIGIAGLSAGGERRITIPAHLAYGNRAMGSDIPKNSSLVFDVKLLEINKK